LRILPGRILGTYPFALQAAPATAPGMGPRTIKTAKKGIRNLGKICKN